VKVFSLGVAGRKLGLSLATQALLREMERWQLVSICLWQTQQRAQGWGEGQGASADLPMLTDPDR
jgi:hypothetical protein